MAKYDLYDSRGNFIGTAEEHDSGGRWPGEKPTPPTLGERLSGVIYFLLLAAGSFYGGVKLAGNTESIFQVLLGLWLIVLAVIFVVMAINEF